MEVTLLGQSHKIHLCTEHAEDTTPGKAKEQLKKKLEELDNIMDTAAAFGMKVIPVEEYEDLKAKKAAAKKPGIVVPSKKARDAMLQQPEERGSEEVQAEAKLKKRSAHEIKAAKEEPGVVDFVPKSNAEKYKIDPKGGQRLRGVMSPHRVKRERDLVETYTIKKTRSGRPISIPSKMESRDGVTRVAISTSIDDRYIQERLKNNKDNPVLDEYDYLAECSLCHGSGISRVNDDTCPKCGGTGYVNR